MFGNTNFVYKIPKDASYVTLRNQNRMLYANYIIQQNNVDGGCQIRVALENGGVADGSIVPKLLEGARETTVEERDRIRVSQRCPVVEEDDAPDIPDSPSGSMRFVAGGVLVQTNVSYPNDTNLAIGTGAFTIEWFQYYEDSDINAIVFSIGTFGVGAGNEICIVYTGTQLFLFVDGSSTSVLSAVTKNVWEHVAVVGNGAADGSRNVKVYVGGVLKLTRTINYDITQTTSDLRIGNQTDASIANGNYAGLITNFRWVKGTEVYTGNFTPPTQALTAISGTELLLLASNETDVVKDSSPANRTPTNTGVVFSSLTPF
jgi:hypothetical protein